MIDQTIVVGPFQCNCRLIACPRTGDAVLIDPGDEAPKILKALERARTPSGAPVKVQALFHTHAHLDHIGATRAVKEAAGGLPSIWLHREDEFIYRMLRKQGELFGFEYDEPLPVDQFFEDEQEISVGDLRFSVLHTPGHSPGSVCLRLHEGSGATETLFTGDTLFQGSVGRSDLWGGDHDLLIRSIRQRVLTLDGDTRVCPGHGPESRVGVEKRSNPFLV